MINLFREYFLGENIFFLRTFFKEFFFLILFTIFSGKFFYSRFFFVGEIFFYYEICFEEKKFRINYFFRKMFCGEILFLGSFLIRFYFFFNFFSAKLLFL